MEEKHLNEEQLNKIAENLGAIRCGKVNFDSDMPDEVFVSDFNQIISVLKISDQELGDIFHISQPTLNRWKIGKNLPYRLIRNSIISVLKKRLSSKK